MTVELVLSGLSLLVTLLLGLLVWHNSRKGNQVAEKKVTVEEQAQIDLREDMVTRRRGEELQRLYERVEKLEEAEEERESEIRILRAAARQSERRERLMHAHVVALTQHIVDELPPPPPTMDPELQSYFEQLEDLEEFGVTEPSRNTT